jgi:hypothetical protein
MSQLVPRLLLVTCAALVAAGCGSTDYGSPETTSSTSKPTKPKAVTPPTPDADLTKKLGADGAALMAAGCTFGSYPEEKAEHVKSVDDLTYDSFPPTSGKHFAIWATPGVYDQPIGDGFAVHNLEHGSVVAWLGTEVSEATTKTVGKVPHQGQKWLVAPRTDLTGLFSAAWGLGLSCPPAALAKLDDATLTSALEAWYDAVNSTGSEAEKDIPAYAGSMKEPTPTRDISEAAPF